MSGPKMDVWLVKTFGTLVAGIGLGIAWSLRSRRDAQALKPVSIGSSAALLSCDLYYVARRRVRLTYLLDAAANSFFCLCWLFLQLTNPGRRQKRR